MLDFLVQPWPWYVAGPIVGLTVPLLLFIGNKSFGISSSLRHTCAACMPGNIEFFNYDWKAKGLWNLFFVAGILIGGFIAGYLLDNPEPVQISGQTHAELQSLGVANFSELIPGDIFNWSNLFTAQGFIMMVVGGFMVGFGARWAGGCTSGHGISGLANLQPASLMAIIGFFIGGLLITYLLLPYILAL